MCMGRSLCSGISSVLRRFSNCKRALLRRPRVLQSRNRDVVEQQRQFILQEQPFPVEENSIAPELSSLWSPDLRNQPPLPTNCAWLNFVLNRGSAPEYLHPYLIQIKDGQLSICYPSRIVQPNFIIQSFVPNITVGSSATAGSPWTTHMVKSFDDLSVSVELPGKVEVPLVRGCPYVTFIFKKPQRPRISTIHAVLNIHVCNEDGTKHKLLMNNGQTWLIYTSTRLSIAAAGRDLSVGAEFRGVLRIAFLPPPDSAGAASEKLLDQFSGTFPTSGRADMVRPFEIRYDWERNDFSGGGRSRSGGLLLMLCLPIHMRLLSPSCRRKCVIPALAYDGIDGKMYGIATGSGSANNDWVLSMMNPAVDDVGTRSSSWFSVNGISDDPAKRNEVKNALRRDVFSLAPIRTDSTYFYGKALARAARLAMIAEELGCLEELELAVRFLRDSMTPWMDGSFEGNGFVYDKKWGGLISRNGARDAAADFGLGIYNDHHYHMGYFCYAGAVLARLHPAWGYAYRSHLRAIAGDFMTSVHPHHHRAADGGLDAAKTTIDWPAAASSSSLSAGELSDVFPNSDSVDVAVGSMTGSRSRSLHAQTPSLFPRYRNFDFWVLHSWAGGLTEFADGRNQESTSEAVNAYYSASLLGMAVGDESLTDAGRTLAAFEMEAARMVWHVPSDNFEIYEEDLVRGHRILGVVWANKRDTGLWFAPPERKECRVGIHVLPITPITDLLFPDLLFVRDLVDWAISSRRPQLVPGSHDDDDDAWMGFIYALQALYDPPTALHYIRSLKHHDDGNSLSNLLWWIYSR